MSPQQHLAARWLNDEYQFALSEKNDLPRLRELIRAGEFLMKRKDVVSGREMIEARLVDLRHEIQTQENKVRSR